MNDNVLTAFIHFWKVTIPVNRQTIPRVDGGVGYYTASTELVHMCTEHLSLKHHTELQIVATPCIQLRKLNGTTACTFSRYNCNYVEWNLKGGLLAKNLLGVLELCV